MKTPEPPKPPTPESNIARNGVIAALFAYLMWGIYPIYFKILGQVPAAEMLAHRIVWSVPFGVLIIIGRKQWPEVKCALRDKRVLGLLTLAAIFLALNWGIYIWAVQAEQIIQASLGYYLNPLIFVCVGVAFLGETLSRAQMLAVGLAAIGVLYLTILGGQFPWISIALALLFTGYGIIRKQLNVGAMPGLFVETLVLFPVAIVYALWLAHQGVAQFTPQAPGVMLLLIAAGPITVLPLLCFALGARRLNLSTIGFLQFISPTLQFICGVYYGESLTPARMICFAFIWSAVAVYCFGAWQARGSAEPKV